MPLFQKHDKKLSSCELAIQDLSSSSKKSFVFSSHAVLMVVLAGFFLFRPYLCRRRKDESLSLPSSSVAVSRQKCKLLYLFLLNVHACCRGVIDDN